MFLKSSEIQYGKGFQNHPFCEMVRNGQIYESIITALDKKDYFSIQYSPKDKRDMVKKYLLKQMFANEHSRSFKHRSLYTGKVGEI